VRLYNNGKFFPIEYSWIDYSNRNKLRFLRVINWILIESKKKSLTNSVRDSLFKRWVEYYVTYVLRCLIFRDIIYWELGKCIKWSKYGLLVDNIRDPSLLGSFQDFHPIFNMPTYVVTIVYQRFFFSSCHNTFDSYEKEYEDVFPQLSQHEKCNRIHLPRLTQPCYRYW
jgi:5'(3')-deoxyribonucleotidase